MRNQDRFFRNLKSIKRSAVPAMRNVDGHSDLVHALDDGDAKIADAFVVALSRTIADHISTVVCELRNSLTQRTKEINIIRPTEMFGILQPKNDSDLSRRFNVIKRRRSVDPHKMIIVMGDEAIP